MGLDPGSETGSDYFLKPALVEKKRGSGSCFAREDRSESCQTGSEKFSLVKLMFEYIINDFDFSFQESITAINE